jgi:hypothetical protein
MAFMIKYRRTTRTAIVFEDLGEMHETTSDTDIMLVLPRWACKLLSKAARLMYLAKLEFAVWRRPDVSLINKICYGFQMA